MSTIKSYNQLPSTVKQSINNVAARAAQNVVNQSKVSRTRPRPARTSSRKSTINSKDARESRVHRRELWFETTAQGLGSKVFNSTTFPEWFASYSKLYETYQMHNLKIHWTTGYSKFVGGYTYVSYNTNPSQSGDPFTISSIFAQQNAGKSQVATDGEITIPRSAYLQQPNRRQCAGPDSYLFDLRYYISASDYNGTTANGSITFWIEYDCTFYTPQSALSIPSQSILVYDSSSTNVNTMGITTTWSAPTAGATTTQLTFTFSNDVSVGTRLRLSALLEFRVKNTTNSAVQARLARTLPTGVTEVGSNVWASSVPSNTEGSAMNYFVFDIVVQESLSVTIPITAVDGLTFQGSQSYYLAHVMAFTHA